MLRSVVGAMAANIMLVQCNSDVPISSACSTASASVRTTESPEPCPRGDLEGLPSGGRQLGAGSSDLLWRQSIRTEVGILDPHAMQDDTDAARQRDHRALRSPAAGNLCGPCPEPSRTAAVHHDRRGLAQSASKVDVAGLGDPTRDITLARLVSRGCTAPQSWTAGSWIFSALSRCTGPSAWVSPRTGVSGAVSLPTPAIRSCTRVSSSRIASLWVTCFWAWAGWI